MSFAGDEWDLPFPLPDPSRVGERDDTLGAWFMGKAGTEATHHISKTLYAFPVPPHTITMQLPKDAERYSWTDYLTWPENERYELIDGVAYAMSPAPQRKHQEISGEIFRQAANALREKLCRVYDAPFDVKLSTAEDDNAPTVVQPDITITCDRSQLTDQGMTGAPDLVIEIVSPVSGLIDRRRKFDLYQRYGVKEYWIVDQDEKVVEVYRLGDDRSYLRAGVFGPDDTVTAEAVPELLVSLGEVFAEEA